MQTAQVQLSDLRCRLTAYDYELFRRGVIMECRVTNATWSNWTTGKFLPEKKYQSLIDLVAARFGLTVFGTEVAMEGGQQ
jgi:hypothetical protein